MVRIDALEANHRAGGRLRHNLVVRAEAGEWTALHNRPGALGLECLTKGIDYKAWNGIALEQARDLLRQPFIGGVVQAAIRDVVG